LKRFGSGSCPVVGFSITDIQLSEFTVRGLFSYLEVCHESHGSYGWKFEIVRKELQMIKFNVLAHRK
jgi:hypothetical protein